MKNVSFAYLMFAGASAAIAAFCFYLVYLAISTRSDGAWLFAAVGLLFSVLPFFALIKVLASRSAFFARIEKAISPEHAEPQGTRFAPHWMLLIGMIAVALLIISVVINIIRSLF